MDVATELQREVRRYDDKHCHNCGSSEHKYPQCLYKRFTGGRWWTDHVPGPLHSTHPNTPQPDTTAQVAPVQDLVNPAPNAWAKGPPSTLAEQLP